jgi:subfamily B ATP-binding cassette protein MsbA/ATP-binding cassette subfamily B protein AbcA/BmrA
MPNSPKPSNPVLPSIRRLLKISGANSAFLFLALFTDLLQAAILIIITIFTRYLFDAVVANRLDAFWASARWIIALSIPGFLLAYFKTWCMGRFSERTLAKLRGMIAARSSVLPVNYIDEHHSGDLLSVLNADLAKLKTLLANNLIDFFGLSIRFLGSLAYIISINWTLTLISTVLTPAAFVLISVLTRPVSKRSEEMQAEIGKVNSVAQDALAGAMVVKSFNLTDQLDQRFAEANHVVLKKGMGIARIWSWIIAAGYALSITPFIIAFGIGGYLIIDRQMTFGSLFAFIQLLNYVVNPLGQLPPVIASMGEAAGAAQRIFKLLDQPSERETGSVTQPSPDGHAVIQFQDVSFSYSDGVPVLKDIALDIHKGQTVAVVGPSGGGKSTLLKLILGYYPPPHGLIRLFGDDLNEWKLSAARQQMAFVAQDSYLFPVSLAENIRIGHPGATQAEIERAARLANIHDFIAGLPDGYETNAGEWGSRLSGGQKQRISLARAILKDAPILLLDEPTSALDTESEALVQEALERFTQDRTTLVIAHRLSTIKNADRVLVLHDGEIVEEGTHDELIEKGGLYLDLYQRQFALDQPGAAPQAGR